MTTYLNSFTYGHVYSIIITIYIAVKYQFLRKAESVDRMKKPLTIRKKIIMLTILVVLGAMLVSGTYFFYTYYSTLKRDAYDKLNSSIDQIASSLSNKFTNIDNASFAFLSTTHLRRWKNGEFDFSEDSPTNFNTIANLRSDIESNLMFNNAWLAKYLDTVYLFADGKCIHIVSRKAESLPQSQSQNELIFKATKDRPEMSFYYLSQQNSPTVYMIRKMNDITRKKQLTLIFTINSDSITQELHQLDSNIAANVVNKSTILFSNNPDLLGKSKEMSMGPPEPGVFEGQDVHLDNDTYFLVHRNLFNDFFSVEFSVPRSVITQEVFHSMQNYAIVMFILLVIFTALAGFAASVYTKFIKDLVMGLNKVRNNNYDAVLPDYRDADLRSISNTFNSMTAEIKTLINTVYKSEILLKEADIKLLQSQMNPHFLVNTLTTISTTALMHGDEQTYRMVTALSNMLDASLYNTEESVPFITIAKEIEHINCYLYLQHVRFQDKLQYTIDIESEDILKLYIPRLSIEPLVENSVIHGIEENISSGIVTVSIRRNENDLLATVTDNGKGFDVEKALQEKGGSKNRSHHIGINNTNRRIKLLFGEEYGIRFESETGVKTCAYVRFPVLTDPEGRNIDL